MVLSATCKTLNGSTTATSSPSVQVTMQIIMSYLKAILSRRMGSLLS